jgi:hypothetical protein
MVSFASFILQPVERRKGERDYVLFIPGCELARPRLILGLHLQRHAFLLE